MDSDKYLLRKPKEKFNIRNEYVFVDLIGFETSTCGFTPKEICLIDGNYKYHKVIKPLYSFDYLTPHCRESVLFDISQFCGIPWAAGDITYIDVIKKNSKRLANRTVILENDDKMENLIDMFLYTDVETDGIEYVSFKELGIDLNFDGPYKICSNHSAHNGYPQSQCALSTASQLAKFVDNNLDFMQILVNTDKIQNTYLSIKDYITDVLNKDCANKWFDDYVYLDFVEINVHEDLKTCKEICLLDKNYENHLIIKPFRDFESLTPKEQEAVSWESAKSGLPYDSGLVEFDIVLDDISKRVKNKRVVVENRYKANYLKSVLSINSCNFECIPLKELGLDINRRELPKICEYHKEYNAHSHCSCALSMTLYLRQIVKKYVGLMDTFEHIMEIKKNCHQHFK